MRGRTGIAVVAAASLVLVACGDDDDDETTGTSEATTATTAATDPAPTETTAAAPGTTVGGTTPGTSAGSDCTLDEPLKIGYAADFSDFGGFADVPGSEAAGVQVDLINDAGGVGGLPVEYVIKELPADPSGAQRVAQEMLDEGVDAIIGPPFAYNGTPLIDTVDGQVPIISNASTDLALADPSRGAFLMSFSDPVQAAAAAEFAGGGGATTAVTFSSPDDPYFTNTTTAFTTAFGEAGGEVVPDFTFGIADEDFSSQVNELASLDPRAGRAVHGDGDARRRRAAQQMEAAGLGDIQVIGADSFDATVVWSAGDVAERGVVHGPHVPPRRQRRAGVPRCRRGRRTSDRDRQLRRPGVRRRAGVRRRCRAGVLDRRGDADRGDRAISDLEVTTGTVTYAGTNGVPEKDVVILTVTDGAPAFTDAFRPSSALTSPSRDARRRGAGGALRRGRRAPRRLRSTSTKASSSPSSAPTAPARRRCSAPSPGSSARPAAGSCSPAPTSPATSRRASSVPGSALVPERRRIFRDLSVGENLQLAGITAAAGDRRRRLDEARQRFPVLADRWSTAAGYLSGGEAQQLAVARALMSDPRLVLLDEPTLGLAPIMVDVVFELLVELRARGRTVLRRRAERPPGPRDRRPRLRAAHRAHRPRGSRPGAGRPRGPLRPLRRRCAAVTDRPATLDRRDDVRPEARRRHRSGQHVRPAGPRHLADLRRHAPRQLRPRRADHRRRVRRLLPVRRGASGGGCWRRRSSLAAVLVARDERAACSGGCAARARSRCCWRRSPWSSCRTPCGPCSSRRPSSRSPAPGWVFDTWSIGGIRLEVMDLVTIGVDGRRARSRTAFVFRRTLFGIAVRAASEDFDAARLMGVRAEPGDLRCVRVRRPARRHGRACWC